MISADPDINITELTDNWRKTNYHKPNDDLNQDFSGEEFLKAVKANFLTLYYAANMIDEIRWNTESKFYIRYVQSSD